MSGTCTGGRDRGSFEDRTALARRQRCVSLNPTARMAARTYVTFEWDTAAEGERDEHDHLIVPAGKEIADHVHARLSEKGLRVSDVDLHETYGWAFDSVSRDVPVWCLLQRLDAWLINTEVFFPVWHWLRGRRPEEQEALVCRAIHEALASGRRARSVRWFARHEFKAGRGTGGGEQP